MRTLADANDAVDRRIAAAAIGRDADVPIDPDGGLCLTATADDLLPLLAGTDVDGRALMAQIHTDTLGVLGRMALSRGGDTAFPVVGGALLSMFLLGWEFGRSAAEAEFSPTDEGERGADA